MKAKVKVKIKVKRKGKGVNRPAIENDYTERLRRTLKSEEAGYE